MYKYRSFTLAVLLLLISCKSIKISELPDNSNISLNKLADEYLSEYSKRYPEPFDYIWQDNTLAGKRVWERREDQWVERLALIKNKFDEVEDVSLLGILDQNLTQSIALRACQTELWKVSYSSGIQDDLSWYLEEMPVENEAQQAKALLLIESLPYFFDTEIANLKIGVKTGYLAPKTMVLRVVQQIDILLDTNNGDSPLLMPPNRARSIEFTKEWATVVENIIRPSLARYSSFLKGEYLAEARNEIGLKSLPSGEACYRAHLIKRTSFDISIDEITKRGQAYQDLMTDELAKLSMKLFNTADRFETYKLAKSFPFESREALLENAELYLLKSKEAALQLFNLQPKTPLIIEPIPSYQERTSPAGKYSQGNLDKDIPAKFLINLYNPEKIGRQTLPRLVIHEGIPGHHMQIGLAQESLYVHTLKNKLSLTTFSEGWAVYAEMLGDEYGLYDDIGRLGYLIMRSVSYMAVELDIGIHHQGWTIEKSTRFLIDRGYNLVDASRIVDRITDKPASVISYLISSLEIYRLRELAKEALGEKFSIREFHDKVLENGAVPISTLQKIINSWVASF